MRKPLIVAAALAAVFLGTKAAGYGHLLAPLVPISWVANEDFIRYASRKVNQRMPMKIANNLTALKMAVSDTGVVLDYQITDMTRERLARSNFGDRVGPPVTHQACGDELLKAVFDRGMDARFVYFDSNGEEVTTVVLDAGNCE